MEGWLALGQPPQTRPPFKVDQIMMEVVIVIDLVRVMELVGT